MLELDPELKLRPTPGTLLEVLFFFITLKPRVE